MKILQSLSGPSWLVEWKDCVRVRFARNAREGQVPSPGVIREDRRGADPVHADEPTK